MKLIRKAWAAALVLFCSLGSYHVLGQGSPVSCNIGSATVPTTLSNWNWENDLTQPDYCNTWAANIAVVGKTFIRAPWSGASSDAIMRIGTTADYRRADGWELVRMDFGGNQNSVDNPYFVLYNKYSSTLRVFMYLVNRPAYTKVIMTLRHATGNGYSTAALGLANPLQVAPDKYRVQPGTSNDLMTYVCKYSGNGWIMGEFTMMFDPNFADQNFFESALQFDIFGITSSTMTLTGGFKFTTQPDDGYGFSGPASVVQQDQAGGLKSFLGQGAKYLGKVGNITKEVESLNKAAASAATSLKAFDSPSKQPLYAAYKLSSFVKEQTQSKAASAIKGVLNFAGSLGSAFSLIGTVVGALWPDNEQKTAVTVTPTVSSGTITLSGSIETSGRLAGLSMQVPGTPHNVPGNPSYNASAFNFARTYQPYYDCPMGLFNLAATPRFERVGFTRRTAFTYPAPYPGQVNPPEFIGAVSYRPMPLQPVYNRAAGIEVVSVKAAIMQKVPFSALNEEFNPNYYYSASFPSSPAFNIMRAQVLTGALQADPYDTGDPANDSPTDDIFLVHTPFVDASCFSQLAFNAYFGDLITSPAFVRVVAVMRRVGASPSDAPIYFVQDYVPDIFNSTIGQTYAQVEINGPTPFGIYQSTMPALYSTQRRDGVVDITNTQSVTAPTTFDAPITLNLTSSSSLTVLASTRLTAGNTISMQGELAIPANTEFVATVDRTAFFQCPVLQATAVGPSNCQPNTWALRLATSQSARVETVPTGVTLAPNPATGTATAVLAGAANEYIQQVELLNLSGQRVWTSGHELLRRERQVTIPLVGVAAGLYVVRVISSDNSYSQKLQVK